MQQKREVPLLAVAITVRALMDKMRQGHGNTQEPMEMWKSWLSGVPSNHS